MTNLVQLDHRIKRGGEKELIISDLSMDCNQMEVDNSYDIVSIK